MRDADRRLVRQRANEACEYCGIRQEEDPLLRFQVEHVIPRQHGGGNHPSNLALACPQCNQRKGPNLSGLDPAGGALTPLFNPRTQQWDEHFRLDRLTGAIEGLTDVGRTTGQLLTLNDPIRTKVRRGRQ